jgi:phage portal protein BeeE
MSFTAVQAAGEARIAAAASVPPQVVGLQVGIEAGGYANYREAFKAFGSGFMRSHWRSFCAALETVCPPPEGAELWFDVSDIAALQDAETERADAMATRASTLASYLMSGFTPESAVSAVLAGDESLLKHTGALSVQLYPGGTVPPSKGPTQ